MTENTKGNLLAAAASLLFFSLCIILPLVGRSARATDHYWANFAAFLSVLAAALACAHLARRLKLRAHREGRGTYPWGSTVLLGILSVLLVCLLSFRLDK